MAYQRGLTRNRSKPLRRSGRRRGLGEAAATNAAIDERDRREEDERGGDGKVEVDGPEAGERQERDGEDRRGRRVDDREERPDGVAMGEGTHGCLGLWVSRGRGSGESRWPHVPPRPPASSIRSSRSSRSRLGARPGRRAEPGIARVIPADGCRDPRGPLPFVRPWTASARARAALSASRSSSSAIAAVPPGALAPGHTRRPSGPGPASAVAIPLLLLESLPPSFGGGFRLRSWP